MELSNIQDNVIGTWTGSTLLKLGPLASSEFTSSTDLSVALTAKSRFLSFTYTWSHENVPQEGLLIVGYDKHQGVASAAWIDSWHMNNKVMYCLGTLTAGGILDLLGSYEAPPGPDWGWRIVISAPSLNHLQVVMYNRTPEGAEALAVRSDYTRVTR